MFPLSIDTMDVNIGIKENEFRKQRGNRDCGIENTFGVVYLSVY